MDREYDITELLISKSFAELDADEKAFALTLVEDEKEYNSLRNIALESKDGQKVESASKDNVMATFDREFASEEVSDKVGIQKYRPYFAAAASLIVLLVIGQIFIKEDNGQLAEKKPLDKNEKILDDSTAYTTAAEKVSDSPETDDENTDAQNQIAELNQKVKAEAEEVDDPKSNEIKLEDDLEEPILPEKAIQDDSKMQDIIVTTEKKDDQPNNTASAYSDEMISEDELANQPAVVSESMAKKQRSVTIAQSVEDNAFRAEKSKSPNQRLFKIKRINKDHYTSY